MKKFFISAVCIFVLGTISCSSAKSVVLNPITENKILTAPNDIKIFLLESEVPKPYKTLGYITGKGSDFDKSSKMLVKMRERASLMGANGLIIDNLKQPSAGQRILSLAVGFGGLGIKKWKATAIFFTNPDPIKIKGL